MSFINTYSKQNYTYYNSKKIGQYTYTVGEIREGVKGAIAKGLITKVNAAGDVLWEKSYTLAGKLPSEFTEIVECANGDILIQASSDFNGTFLIRLDPDGNSIWQRFYADISFGSLYTANDNIIRIEENGKEAFILVYVYKKDEKTLHLFLKIDGNGNLQLVKVLDEPELSISKITGTIGKFAICGSYKLAACVLELDFNFNVLRTVNFPAEKMTLDRILSARYIDGNLVVQGQLMEFQEDAAPILYDAFAVIPQPQTPAELTLKFFPTFASLPVSRMSDEFIFVEYFDRHRAVIRKFDMNFDMLWTKAYNFLAIHPAWGMLKDVTNSQLVILDGAGSSEEFGQYGIGNTNLDLVTCRTENLVNVTFKTTKQKFALPLLKTEKFTYSGKNTTLLAAPVVSIVEEVCPHVPDLEITEDSMLQSGHFYMQSAGSQGNDSTRGIHLRWTLKGSLLNHLPKADYAQSTHHFNKPDDYVRIYKSVYVPRTTYLDLTSVPGLVYDNGKYWVYSVGNYLFYVHFRDAAKYNQVRNQINPSQDPELFIKTYGKALIEIENRTQLSFSITPMLSVESPDNRVKLELLSVEENKITAPRGTTLRTINAAEELHNKKLVSENIRSIRLTTENCYLKALEFELYVEYIMKTLDEEGFSLDDKYALTLDTNLAFDRLEPVPGVLGPWLRYNDMAFVNPDNYKTRWNGDDVEPGAQIVNTVKAYIILSDEFDNPTAIESVPEMEGFELSNLELLKMASLDFHTARMLGLGILDIDQDIDQDTYVYLAEYHTFGDLQDGLGARHVQHLYCSLPTSVDDQRLPLAVDLDEVRPGIFYSADIEEAPDNMLGADGYSSDGLSRYLTLYNKELPEEPLNAPFFWHDYQFSSAQRTLPVYCGLEYKNHDIQLWKKPELTYDRSYFNIDESVSAEFTNETKSLLIPEASMPLFIHQERENGTHDYSSYGINWFSRATSSEVVIQVDTVIAPKNTLKAPSNLNAWLIQSESPLMFSSVQEQTRFSQILPNQDKTLVRLLFEYNHSQELKNYLKAIDDELITGYIQPPDDKELFASDLEIFFRSQVPNIVSGKITLVTNHSNPLLAIVATGPYTILSEGTDEVTGEPTQVLPHIPISQQNNFIGAVLVANSTEFVVHEIDLSGTYPIFTVFKRDISGALVGLDTDNDPANLEMPTEFEMFMLVENMQNEDAWGLANPVSLHSNIGVHIPISQTTIHQEEIYILTPDGAHETHLQKFRGIFENGIIERVLEPVEDAGPPDTQGTEDPSDDIYPTRHLGLYKITFNSALQHPHVHSNNDSVEWYNGIVRLRTLPEWGQPNEPRKTFKVVRTQNIGTQQNLVVYFVDPAFPSNAGDVEAYDGKIIPDGLPSVTQQVNYYPGYRVYLYTNPGHNLTTVALMPPGEPYHYSIFGVRSHGQYHPDNAPVVNFESAISVPALLFAQPIIEPVTPAKPLGGKYATRPDFFNKASYTFTTQFGPTPHSVQFNRASDIQFLSAVYEYDTLTHIMNNVFLQGNSQYYVNRWENFLSFDYAGGVFASFPDGDALPMPDSENFIDAINDFVRNHNVFYNDDIDEIDTIENFGDEIIPAENWPDGTPRNGQLKVIDFFKTAILNCFVPLTEVPVIFEFIKGGDYVPQPKKQVVRDRNGELLKTTDPAFDMAPMMKIIGPQRTQFTDFGLDGASNAKYFYASREINIQMKTSEYSGILGPIGLVNSAPPTSPDIIRTLPILENRALGIEPAIRMELNAYPRPQNIAKINLYRAFTMADALTVRTMKLVKQLDLAEEQMEDLPQWQIIDPFFDLPEIPFGDALYYRATVSRIIKYNDRDGELVIDYAPSEATKLVITNIVDNYTPESPILKYVSEPPTADGVVNYITLFWEKTTYKGKYHIYKMNAQGNFVKIAEVTSNDAIIYLSLDDTDLASHSLDITDPDGNTIYHHFKVLAENTSGMVSTKENILTIYIPETWTPIGGIGEMIVEGTFIVRP